MPKAITVAIPRAAIVSTTMTMPVAIATPCFSIVKDEEQSTDDNNTPKDKMKEFHTTSL
jgi:hypothetical protein